MLVFPSESGQAEIAAGPQNPRVTFDIPPVTDDTSVTVRIADHTDVVHPHVVCAAPDGNWHRDNIAIPCTAEDDGSGLANADDASFALHTSIPAGAESAAATTDTRQVCDVAGNCATAGPITRLRIDRRPPDAGCAAASAAWSGADVSIVCAPRDGGAGLAAGAPDRFVLSTSTTPGTEDPAAASDSRSVCDAVGNCRTAGPFAAHVDRRPPATSCAPVEVEGETNARVACRSFDGGAGLADPADAAFELSTAVGAGTRDPAAMTGTREVCDRAGNCATVGPFGPFDVTVSGPSSADADKDGVPDRLDFCPDRAGACVPAVPGASARDRRATAAMAARAIAAGCRTAESPGAWAALTGLVRDRARAEGTDALTSAGSAECIGGVAAFAVAESSPRPDARTNDAYVSSLPKALGRRRAENAACRADRRCHALAAAASRVLAASSRFGASSLELAVARNRFATAVVQGRKNDAALQKALLLLAEGNVARAQQDAAAAERGLAAALRRARVDTTLSAAAFGPVLTSMRAGGSLPPSAVSAIRAARLDPAELTAHMSALPPPSANLRVEDVFTASGASSREAVRRRLTLSQLEGIVAHLLPILGTHATDRLFTSLEGASSVCTLHTRAQALRAFRRTARSLTATRMLDAAVDPLVIGRHRCR